MSEMKNVTHYEPGTESRFSFDEVESIVTHKDQVLQEAEDSSAWSKVEELTKNVEKLADKVEEVASEPKETENAADFKTDSLSEDNSEEKQEEVQKQIDNDTKVLKKLTAKLNDLEQELDPNLTVVAKVDGQEVPVSVQELLNNFSGKQAWDKRFQELDKERKSFQQERQLIEKYISDFADKVKSNDAIGAIEYLAQFAGVNPLEFRRSIREALTPQIKKFLEMDDAQRKVFTQSEELEFLKRERESELQRMQQQQSVKELESQVVEFQKTHNLTEEQLVELHDDIKKTYDGEVTLELMGQVLQLESRFKQADAVLNEVDAELATSNDNVNLLVDLMAKHPELTHEDLVEIVKETYSQPQKQALKNISKKTQGQKPKQKVEEKPAHKSKMDSILLNFDDL